MTNIIIDTNIFFSALLNTNSRIGQIIINGSRYYSFFAPEYMRVEVFKYKEKIKRFAKLNDDEFIEIYELIVRNITILNQALIPKKVYRNAELLCKGIDMDDTPFVAMSEFVKGHLWTGDKMLIKGLTDLGYKNIVTTEQLYKDFILMHKL